jgi:hypothetical protein
MKIYPPEEALKKNTDSVPVVGFNGRDQEITNGFCGGWHGRSTGRRAIIAARCLQNMDVAKLIFNDV